MESQHCLNEINLTPALVMCVYLSVCTWMCVCVGLRVSRAVKVRLIHWLQQRRVERSAEFYSDQFSSIVMRNVFRLATFLLQQTASFAERGEPGQVSDLIVCPSFIRQTLAILPISAEGQTGWLIFKLLLPFTIEGCGGRLNHFPGCICLHSPSFIFT